LTGRDFYNVYSYGDDLRPGNRIKIEHTLSFAQEGADLTDLTVLSVPTLEDMKKTSEKQEKVVFDKLCAATEEWEQQGANTLRIVKALEYLRTAEVQHTSNIWEKG